MVENMIRVFASALIGAILGLAVVGIIAGAVATLQKGKPFAWRRRG